MRPGSVALTQEGMVFGTPEFMSPEQAQGKVLTPASDVYSLAVILYEVLTGKLPFEAKSPLEYIQAHVTAKPIPLEQRAPGRQFPPLLMTVINRALAKKPEERFLTTADFAAAMQAVLDGRTALPASSVPGRSPLAQTPDPTSGHLASSPTPVPVAAKGPGAPVSNSAAPDASLPARGKRVGFRALATIAVLCVVVGAVIAALAMKFTMR
jgi:serine/threonine-protein kinase